MTSTWKCLTCTTTNSTDTGVCSACNESYVETASAETAKPLPKAEAKQEVDKSARKTAPPPEVIAYRPSPQPFYKPAWPLFGVVPKPSDGSPSLNVERYYCNGGCGQILWQRGVCDPCRVNDLQRLALGPSFR